MSFLAKAATLGLDVFANGVWADTIRSATRGLIPQGDGRAQMLLYAVLLTVLVVIAKRVLYYFIDDDDINQPVVKLM